MIKKNFKNFKKSIICICTAFSLLFTVSCVAAKDNASSKIDNFRGYEWNTSIDDIQPKEISPEMEESVDYQIDEEPESGIKGILVNDGYVDKYDAAVGFLFLEDALIAGMYELGIDDNNFYDIASSVSEKYGEPFLEKDSEEYGKCFLWIDEEGGCIALSADADILVYIAPDSPFVEFASLTFESYHEIDLPREIEKATDRHIGF